MFWWFLMCRFRVLWCNFRWKVLVLLDEDVGVIGVLKCLKCRCFV